MKPEDWTNKEVAVLVTCVNAVLTFALFIALSIWSPIVENGVRITCPCCGGSGVLCLPQSDDPDTDELILRRVLSEIPAMIEALQKKKPAADDEQTH